MLEHKFYSEKLKAKTTIETDPPTLIQTKFLVDSEIYQIKSKVLDLAEHWKYLNPLNQSAIPTRMLPRGMYTRSFEQYKVEVSEYRSFMYSNFSELYEKVKIKLIDYLKLDLMYHSETNYPGFHIFKLVEGYEYGEFHWYNFHRDGFTYLNKFTTYDKVYSCVVPIEVPKLKGSLLYTLKKPKFKTKLDEDVMYERIRYNIGDLIIWPGNLIHSIEPFFLNKNENRITLQFHIASDKSKGIIFW